MKLQINLEDDEELREAVKEMVRGQIKSIVRSEVSTICAREAALKMPSILMDSDAMRRIFRNELHTPEIKTVLADAVQSLVEEDLDIMVQRHVIDLLKGGIRDHVKEALADSIQDAMPSIEVAIVTGNDE